jgi:tetratricopeptide (TPR) repeat protein
MCKPMLVTLPAVLLLLDYWPLQREKSRKFSWLVLEKLPLLAVAAAGCAVTLWGQHQVVRAGGSFTLQSRLGNALVSYMAYLGQMFWPARLAVFYPYPHHGLPVWEVVLAGTLIAVLSTVALWQRRKQPWLLMGWLWYLVMLLPVIGVIQVGDQAHADRYSYLPQIGMYLAVTWLVAECQVNSKLLGGLMAGIVVLLMVCAWKQTTYWTNTVTLWNHTLACTTDNAMAHCNLGDFYSHHGRMDEAVAQYEDALRIDPSQAEAHVNLGLALAAQQRTQEAIAQYRMALGLEPSMPGALNNLAWILATDPHAEIRNGAEAVQLAARACAVTRDSMPLMLGTLGAAYAEAGDFDKAIACAQKAHDLAVAQGLEQVAAKNLELLELYRSHHAYHEKS